MATTQYVGARYVPVFGRLGEQSIDWDNSKPYEPLTIVLHEGNSYTSRQFVPVGIDILNEDFWAETGNYNAQVEQYRQEVVSTSETAKDAAAKIDAITPLDAAPAANSAKGVTSGGVHDAISEVESTVNAVMPFDAKPTQGSSKGVTSGGVYDEFAELSNNAMLTEMVIIGDSFSTTGYEPAENELWWNIVANRLNLNPHNFAVSGTGYAATKTPNFQTQIQNAANSKDFENNKVKYVFIYGGRNDLNPNYFITTSTYTSQVANTIQVAIDNFPSAQILVAGINTLESYSAIDYNTSKTDWVLTRIMKLAANEKSVSFINMLNNLACQTDLFNSTDKHPSVKGQKLIAANMLNGISGNCSSNTTPFWYLPIEIIDGTSVIAPTVFCINGIFKLNGTIRMNDDGTAKIKLPNNIGIFAFKRDSIAGFVPTTKKICNASFVDDDFNIVKLNAEANNEVILHWYFEYDANI